MHLDLQSAFSTVAPGPCACHQPVLRDSTSAVCDCGYTRGYLAYLQVKDSPVQRRSVCHADTGLPLSKTKHQEVEFRFAPMSVLLALLHKRRQVVKVQQFRLPRD